MPPQTTSHETPETDRRVRRWTRAQDRRLAGLLIFVTILSIVVFTVMDVLFKADGLGSRDILMARALAFVVSVGALLVLRQQPRPVVFDWTMTIWLSALLAMQVVVATVRPAGWSPVPVINMLLVLGTYTLLPVPTRFQVVPVAAFSLINGGLILMADDVGPERVQTALLASYVLANVLGFAISRRHHGLQQRQFLILTAEREARHHLRMALDEVKVLRGIVPICSYCKKIRNDEGLYEAVEEYITRHSEADFSHTLCPTCFGEHYPEEVPSSS